MKILVVYTTAYYVADFQYDCNASFLYYSDNTICAWIKVAITQCQ